MASLDYKLHGFYMTVDLAINAAPTIQQSSLLLSKDLDFKRKVML